MKQKKFSVYTYAPMRPDIKCNVKVEQIFFILIERAPALGLGNL